MDALVEKQRYLLQQLEIATQNYNARQEVPTRGYLAGRLVHIERHWEMFMTNDQRIFDMITDANRDHQYFQNHVAVRAEDLFFTLKGDLLERIDQLQAPNAIPPPHADPVRQMVNLPPVNIPSFNGTYEDWPSFYNLFNSVIHGNESIPAVQKL